VFATGVAGLDRDSCRASERDRPASNAATLEVSRRRSCLWLWVLPNVVLLLLVDGSVTEENLSRALEQKPCGKTCPVPPMTIARNFWIQPIYRNSTEPI
jgi:hypothetical protein